MIEGSAQETTGLVRRGPALSLLGGLLAVALLLAACGRPLPEQRLQGVVLDTGYHLTLHGDLDTPRLGVAIESELARQAAAWSRFVEAQARWQGARRLPGARPPPPWPPVLGHAWLVDRLHERLLAEGVETFLVEVGGIRRGRGAWPVALPGEDRRLTLEDEALVSLVWHEPDGPHRLSVVADGALAALALAWQGRAAGGDGLSHPGTWVVTSPTGERLSEAMAARLGPTTE